MDSVTQAVLGSAVAASIAPSGYRKRAIVTGAALGTLPDLDVLLNYATDVDNFTHHRGFSHSLFILPIVAAILLPMLRRFYALISWQRLYALIALSLMTHPLLDALTSYGTQLFYPLAVTPTYIASIFIIDPLYTLWLLVGVFMYWLAVKWRWVNHVALVISTFYLGVGIGIQQHARKVLVEHYPSTNSGQWFVDNLTTSPFCWRGVYKANDHYTEVAFNVLNPQHIIEQQYTILPKTRYPDDAMMNRLLWFNPDTVLRQRGQQLITSDLRMGEFGFYVFEFIIQPAFNSGQQLSMTDKQPWLATSMNKNAETYIKNDKKMSYPKRKWHQFLQCLRGGI